MKLFEFLPGQGPADPQHLDTIWLDFEFEAHGWRGSRIRLNSRPDDSKRTPVKITMIDPQQALERLKEGEKGTKKKPKGPKGKKGK